MPAAAGHLEAAELAAAPGPPIGCSTTTRGDDDDELIDEEVRILSEVFREQTGFSILNEDQSDWSGAFKLVSISCTILFVGERVGLAPSFGHGLRGGGRAASKRPRPAANKKPHDRPPLRRAPRVRGLVDPVRNSAPTCAAT